MESENDALKLHTKYTRTELLSLNLKPFKKNEAINANIYLGTDQVYFFAETDDERMELYSVISQSSFYLK